MVSQTLSMYTEIKCYADDTIILLKHKNCDDLFKISNLCLDRVKKVGLIIIVYILI